METGTSFSQLLTSVSHFDTDFFTVTFICLLYWVVLVDLFSICAALSLLFIPWLCTVVLMCYVVGQFGCLRQ